jgi:hypothetical protein
MAITRKNDKSRKPRPDDITPPPTEAEIERARQVRLAGTLARMPLDVVIAKPLDEFNKTAAAAVAAYVEWFRVACVNPATGLVHNVEMDIEMPLLDDNGNPVRPVRTQRMRITRPIIDLLSHPTFMPDTLDIDVELEAHPVPRPGVPGEVRFDRRYGAAPKAWRQSDTTPRVGFASCAERVDPPEGVSKLVALMRGDAMARIRQPGKKDGDKK